MTPEKPPHMNIQMKPRARTMGGVKRIRPPQMVPSQLKILTPVGTAMAIVRSEKAAVGTGPRPVVNMWWLQTAKPRKPMTAPEKTMIG
jgi:hypothetical protein